MGMVMFYHLTQSTAEQTARVLMARALDQGWRIMIRGTDPGGLDALDTALWASPDESFLPHGREGGVMDSRQPVLLGQGEATNGAQALILIDGAEVAQTEAERLDRVWVLFDGSDPDGLAKARSQWKRLTEAGLPAQYWSEESGRWEKKAERG